MQSRKNFDLKYYLEKSGRMSKMLTMEDRYRTCCNCWHIRAGTIVLGLIELVAVTVILNSVIRQLRWKSVEQAICSQKHWRDCLSTTHNFNLTLMGDYVIAMMLFSIAFCILLLFYGVLTCRPKFLLPHLIVQAIGLLFSFGYFFLYAWSYFYGDLYIESKNFALEYFVERMWLSAIILVFAIFQCYLFFSVVKCSLYLSKLQMEQQRRFMQFEEVSNRVRLAKENGLWRSTSWGGSFQQYRGQYERKAKKPEEKKPNNNRVQWNLEKNVEKSISCGLDSSHTTNLVDETEDPTIAEPPPPRPLVAKERTRERGSTVADASPATKWHSEGGEKSAKRSPGDSPPRGKLTSTPSVDSTGSQLYAPMTRGSARRSSATTSSSSRTRHSRESESSNNSVNAHGAAEKKRRRQYSAGETSAAHETKKSSPKQQRAAVAPPSANALIYTKIAPQSQKPVPQAVVRLRPMKFPTFDYADAARSSKTSPLNKAPTVGVGSAHNSLRRIETGPEKSTLRQNTTEEMSRNSSANSARQPTIPRVKKISIASKAIQPQS